MTADGYLPVHREVHPDWQGWAHADDVTLTAYNPDATVVELGASAPAVMVNGTSSNDAAGGRTPRLYVPAGTTATLEGPSTSLDEMTLRITEYTVGDDGPSKMPAPLPPSSAYTHAVELSVDEAVEAGATGVVFNSPGVVYYVENFPGFPTGVQVPVGRYDRVKRAWVPEPNGRVIRIVSESGGMANLDVTGDGVVDTGSALTDLGITNAERTQLATTYAPSAQGLWRSRLTHFSPIDCNFPTYPPCDTPGCDEPPGPPDGPTPPDDDDCEEQGSIIECTNQILGERIAVPGTETTLNYRSDRVPGNLRSRTVRVPLTTLAASPFLTRGQAVLEVAGRRIENTVTCDGAGCTPGQTVDLTWDGKDRFGRYVQGAQHAVVRWNAVFPVLKGVPPADFAPTFARAAAAPTVPPLRSPIGEGTRTRRWDRTIGNFDARSFGLGGWTLSNVHVYEPSSRILHYGDGRRRQTSEAQSVLRSFSARKGLAHAHPDGGVIVCSDQVAPYELVRVALDGTETNLGGLPSGFGFQDCKSLEVAPDGAVHVGGKRQVYKRTGFGTWQHVAGAGTSPPSPESGAGGPATSAVLATEGPQIAVAPDGSVYIGGEHRIWKVLPDGTIHVVAATGSSGSVTDGVLATASIVRRYVDAIEVGRDGSVYFVDRDPPTSYIRKIDPEGFVRYVAGGGAAPVNHGPSGNVENANLLVSLGGLAVAPGGEILARDGGVDGWGAAAGLATEGVLSIRDGAFTAVAGTLWSGAGCNDLLCGEGGPAAAASFHGFKTLSLHPSGRLILTHANFNYAQLAIEPALPGLSLSNIAVPTADAREVDIFDGGGRHVETRDAETGLLLTEITYEEDGTIDYVTDWRGVTSTTGRVTNIERVGSTVTVTGPDGHVTTLTLDADGWLESVALPGATSSDLYEMAYHGNGGLLASFRKPESTNPSLFRYDAVGRLIEDEDPMGNVIELAFTDTAEGRIVTHQTPSGVTKTFDVSEPGNGERTRTVTKAGVMSTSVKRPDGASTITQPDGTVITRKLAPDPRWGMLAPYVASETTDPPGSVPPRVVMRERTVSSTAGPLSFGTLTEETWINPTISGGVPTGPSTTRIFDQGSPTEPMTETLTSPLGDVIERVLDPAGRVSSLTPPDAVAITFGYDDEGHMLTSTQGAGGAARTTTRTYRADGMLGTLTNAENQLSTFDWDAAGRLIEIERPDLEAIGFGFDQSGNLDSVTPPDQPAHLFGQDDLDQVTLYDPPGATTFNTLYAFDVDRRVDLETRPGSIALDYVYFAADGRLQRIQRSTTEKIELTYFATGRVQTRKGPTWASGTAKQTLTYGYDGRLVTSEALTGDVAGTVGWTYDARHLPATEVVTPVSGSAQSVSFGYDAEGALTAAGVTAGELTIGRGDGGRIDSISNTWSSQTILETRAYDAFGALENILVTRNGAPLFQEHIVARDKLGRIVEREEAFYGDPFDTYEYEYDLAGRLTRVWKNAVEVEEYAYDANGNRTSAQYNGGTPRTASAADTQDRIATYGPYTLGYQNNGEVSSRASTAETWQFAYNAFGGLTTSISSTDGAKRFFDQDALGRRVRLRFSSTFYGAWLWRSALQPVAQLTSTGAIQQRYLYADSPNVPELVITSGNERWRVIKDHLGSVRLIVDTASASGGEKRRRTYDAFGRITLNSGTGDVPFGFAGGFYRPEIPFVRFGARDYDPEMGRWTSKDPIRFEGGDSNIYAYAGNDPVNAIDPSGKAGEQGISAMSCLVFAMLWADLKYDNGDRFDQEKHCYVSCMASRCMGTPFPALGAGAAWEELRLADDASSWGPEEQDDWCADQRGAYGCWSDWTCEDICEDAEDECDTRDERGAR